MGTGGEASQQHVSAREWWGPRRLRYNLALLLAGLLGSSCWVLVALWCESDFRSPYESARPLLALISFWLRPLLVCLAGLLAVGNAGYLLGPLTERIVPARFVAAYRRLAFALGLGLSVLVPFVIPSLFAAFLTLSALAGHGRPVRRADLPGRYVANYGPALSALTLTDDGRFTQTVRVRTTGKVYTAAGTWSFDPDHKEIALSEGFLVPVEGWDGEEKLVPDFDHPKIKGLTIWDVRWLVGKLEIGGDGIPWGRVGGEIPYTRQAGHPD